ncbi:4-carboxy-2-hydroxymuconate-6-semialdehyde dehydrogenase [Pontiella desulfatans]|uniref:4-carboxy-2-hydroxymuconate-6-semialdehyde dehydrogenase n=1 Tax=Pontiella desulfatans TaxID=2750659 RepID=A0A6C2TV94_PONDE|nr:Gfo/Idh/MocA family oxidoreductase [Pontiella desulfatans]VGO11483.1 4-carboxy-2-hydroxymuconate-6-semialdehyde dehydrogenase [Pontiella desulfatans]
MKTTRQHFLKTSALLGAAVGFPSIIPSSVLGQNGSVSPSNRVAIGVVGCGGRANACWEYKNYDKSEIIATCDPNTERRVKRAREWGAKEHYNDFRDMIARDDIDAVHVVTGDYWHVPISIAAAKAGKDVYCEKPLGLSIGQNLASRQIVNTYNRVFQYGTQQRSQQHLRMGIDLVLNGHIGDVKEVFVWAPQGGSGGSLAAEPVPEGFDMNLWLGPAPEAPFSTDRCLKSTGAWFVYDYAIGFIAGWGAHPVDQLQWWADEEGLGIPVEYETTGKIPVDGLFNTVSHWDMQATYANGTRLWFTDAQTAKTKQQAPDIAQLEKFGNCTQFVGDKGWVAVSRAGMMASTEELRRKAKDPGPRRLAPSSGGHLADFVNSVLARKQPVAPLESAILSDTICHLGDIGIRTGETLQWDPEKETVVGSDAAVKMMHRPMRAPFDQLMA